MQVRSLGREDPLGKEMATHSNIHAWENPIEKPGGLQSMGYKESDTLSMSTYLTLSPARSWVLLCEPYTYE